MNLPSYILILGIILTCWVTCQYQNVAFALVDNNSSQVKEGFSIYHSPKLGFEMAYPSDWSVEESSMGDGIYINAPISTNGKIDNTTKNLEEVLEEAKSKIEEIESGESESILMQIRIRNQTVEILITSRHSESIYTIKKGELSRYQCYRSVRDHLCGIARI